MYELINVCTAQIANFINVFTPNFINVKMYYFIADYYVCIIIAL